MPDSGNAEQTILAKEARRPWRPESRKTSGKHPPRPSPEPPSAPFSRVPWDPLPWCSWLPDPAFRQRGTGCHTNLYIAARPPLGGQGKHALKADLEARARPTLAQLAFRQRGAGSERNLRKARRTRPAREQGNKPRKSTHNSSARPAHVAQTRVPPTWRWISPEPPQFRTARRMPERETDQTGDKDGETRARAMELRPPPGRPSSREVPRGAADWSCPPGRNRSAREPPSPPKSRLPSATWRGRPCTCCGGVSARHAPPARRP